MGSSQTETESVNPNAPRTPLSTGGLARFFSFVIRWRWAVLLVYALIVPPSAYFAARVGQDNAIDRLVVASDPDYINTRAFEHVFGSGEYALLIAEADDVFAPEVLGRVDRLERAIAAVPGVQPNSALSIYRRAKAGFDATAAQADAFRRFVTGTDLLRRQGLVGPGFLAIALVLDVRSAEGRRETIAAIDAAIAAANPPGGPLRSLSRIGAPYVNIYLDETQRSAYGHFLLFTAFVIVLNIALYRSLRTLAAFLATLGVCLAVSVGYIGVTGGTFTIVSPMVPMTILVTATATLVYLHSRFVERPPGVSVDDHQVFALVNKFLPCSASIFATAVGFAALTVSNIRPIREMGMWVAVGLLCCWGIVFTLFPALQKILRTPTSEEGVAAGGRFLRFANRLPRFTYRWRWPLVVSSLVLSAGGAVAIFGLPGVVASVPLLVDPVAYMNPSSPLYQDTKRLGALLPGMSLTEVWLRGELGSVSEPEVLTGLHGFQERLDADADIGVSVGVVTLLRIMKYLGGGDDRWPDDPEAIEAMAADLESLASQEPMLGRFVQTPSFAQTHVAVISRASEYEDFRQVDDAIRRHWEQAVAAHPALRGFTLETVGLGPLQTKMSQSLVPTLVESFLITVTVIFATFLVVFRNGTARLMAMIPSIFAILVMFGVMRVCGLTLNAATILIASTVLGTSENDQIHFFYHYLEGRERGTVEQAMRHTLLVAGRAILYATVINAGGFLAFVLAELPPVRDFGWLSAVAFALSMLADFTALPAALWILFRACPDPPGDTAAANAGDAAG